MIIDPDDNNLTHKACILHIESINRIPNHKKHQSNKMNSRTQEEILDTIAALRENEIRWYSVSNYLAEDNDVPVSDVTTEIQQDSDPIDETCRSLMIEWANKVAGYFGYDRETVAMAINNFDRFMLTPCGKNILLDQNKFMYQLAVIAALYSSVKMHEQKVLNPTIIYDFCDGAYSPDDITAMESTILVSLQWRINPPTSIRFVQLLIEYATTVIPISDTKIELLLEYSMQQIEFINETHGLNPSMNSFAISLTSILKAVDKHNDLLKDELPDDIFEGEFKKSMNIDLSFLITTDNATFCSLDQENESIDTELDDECLVSPFSASIHRPSPLSIATLAAGYDQAGKNKIR